MSDALMLTAIAAATVLATGIGALPVIALGAARARAAQGVLSGLAAGVMAIAATVGLLKPAAEQGSATTVVVATAVGAIALVISRLALRGRARHKGSSEAGARSLLVIGVLFAHSLPEGFAIGSAFASSQAGLSALVITAIAIQNVPEGTATAAAMQPAGYPATQQFWGAVLTSVPQVPGALVAWLAVEQIDGLLPASFALAGRRDARARRRRPAARRVEACLPPRRRRRNRARRRCDDRRRRGARGLTPGDQPPAAAPERGDARFHEGVASQ